jgi:hypothetical protein
MMMNVRIAEDDATNATEAVDTNLRRVLVAVISSSGVSEAHLNDHDE